MPVLYRQISGYVTVLRGNSTEMNQPVGRGIRTATVIYLALASEQPPCEVPAAWERQLSPRPTLSAGGSLLAAFFSTFREPRRTKALNFRLVQFLCFGSAHQNTCLSHIHLAKTSPALQKLIQISTAITRVRKAHTNSLLKLTMYHSCSNHWTHGYSLNPQTPD